MDLACLLFAAPVLVPVMAIIALAIRLSSSGPVFFRQERIGLNCLPFICLKFRTMRSDAAPCRHQAHVDRFMTSGTPMKKLDETDDRVLAVGRLLRASGLDELPQVINILRGEMSLVGPRPCIRYEFEKYRPEHHGRFRSVPGLTGLWQVSNKNETTFQEMIELDEAYGRNLSLRQDLAILFRTFPVLFRQTSQTWQVKRSTPAPGAGEVRRHQAQPHPSTSV